MFFYTIGIRLYGFSIRLASPFNPKAKQWLLGRKKQAHAFEAWAQDNTSCNWFHCASLGEYEMAIPIISKLKTTYPDEPVLVTFFSPSGYLNYKDDPEVDGVFYLPLDTPKNASRFVSSIIPKRLFLVKYEFWFHHLTAAKKIGAKLYLVNGVFRKSQIFFKPYGKWALEILRSFDQIFVCEKGSQNLLSSHDVSSILSGDSRFDRVLQLTSTEFKDPKIEQFLNGEKALVLGSAWEPELNILAKLLRTGFDKKVLVFTHDVSEAFIKKTKEILPEASTYSTNEEFASSQVMIVDTIGILKYAYRWAEVAFVGGGFGSGLHNILEPLGYEVPVVFGPKVSRYHEVELFSQLGVTRTVENETELSAFIGEAWGNNTWKQTIEGELERNNGVTDKIMTYVKSKEG